MKVKYTVECNFQQWKKPDVKVLLFGGQNGRRLRCTWWSEVCVPGSTRQYMVLMLQAIIQQYSTVIHGYKQWPRTRTFNLRTGKNESQGQQSAVIHVSSSTNNIIKYARKYCMFPPVSHKNLEHFFTLKDTGRLICGSENLPSTVDITVS